MPVMDDLTATTFVLPDAARPEVQKLRDFLAEHDQGRLRLLIDDHESIIIPSGVEGVLRMVVEAFSRGLAVSVIPQSQVLTTQQAAELLGISRPTLIRILDAGRIPYQQVGTHRRLLLEDVLHYREERREAQYKFLADTALSLDDEEDIDTVLARLRRVRQRNNQ